MKDASRPPSSVGGLAQAGRLLPSLILDTAIVIGSYALALYLRFDGNVPNESWHQLVWAGPLIAFAYILAYQAFGVYRTAWQYGSVRDALLLAAAVAVVTAGILLVNALLPKRPLPLSVNVISAAFIFLFHGMARMLPKLGRDATIETRSSKTQRVLVVGAGDAGQALLRELRANAAQPYRIACFVDDNPSLHGKRVHGTPVVGGRLDIPTVIERYLIDLVAIALPAEHTSGLQELLALCEPSKVPVRIVPGAGEIMAGRARGDLREITIEDLLAREPMTMDEEACRRTIEGRVVLIVGAAGSIGSELTRRLFSYQPAGLHLLDTAETGLYELRSELRMKAGPDATIKTWIANISDRQKLQDVFEESRPQVVFHLAALKHITMVEDHPDQGFETNVVGTLNVFEAAQSVQAEQVVFISSHTAVNPASVYGATKRVGELLVNSSGGKTHFCAVRLTNVLDARGSVLGIFTRQIQSGGPVSVTDPEVARYFLSISEVVSLVIQAVAMCKGGEIFLFDTGEELRIGDLAERMIRQSGLEPGDDVPIIYTGLRPGEKLRENLIGEHERLEPTTHPRMLMSVSSLSVNGAELRAGIRELEVDRRRRAGNLPARLHALARLDRAQAEENAQIESTQEP